ncbi:MAG TPA: hypothetical protein VL157_00950 [Gemmatimonadaceae bacterium]|jgi:hypothetical protein|nr:hypothetical protein [Gemmatimonadaceae bacterium]
MRPRFIPPALLAAAALAAAGSARAQGTVSTQGFGYPPGQISAAAAALGGGPAETDAQSALNPAAIAAWIRPGIYVEYAPEFRTVTANGQSDHTTTSRFPLMSGAITLGSRVTAGISVSTLLDRTWETSRSGFDHFASDSVQFTENFKVSGAINDVKPGLSVAVLNSLWLGVSADVYSGDNNLTILRTSQDTTVRTFSQQSRLSFSGIGASGGIMWQPGAQVAIGVSGRLGGRFTVFRNDTVLTRATAPKRAGAGITFTGLPGIVLAFHTDWDGWSSMNGLGQPGLFVTNTWTYGGGAEVRGPVALGAPIALRVGYQHRGLPFLVNSSKIFESSYSGGLGFLLSQGRSRVDFTLVRASRTGLPGVTEHAWTAEFGIMVRP